MAKVLTRDQIIKDFGIDCGGGLEWRNWEPGGEYPKKLVLRNVEMRTKHIKYTLPATKFFGMDFPQLIVLSPGMSISLEVHSYDDVLECTTDHGTFSVPIKAVIPKVAVTISNNAILDFDLCPVNETTTKSFDIKNTGELDFEYNWIVKGPFVITPSSGKVRRGGSELFSVSFSPKDASVWVSTATISVKNGQSSDINIIKLKATAKFPFITTTIPELQFGEVYTGKTIEKSIQLKNVSLVRSSFKIKRLEADYDPLFSLSTMSGNIPAGGSVTVQVSFSPHTTGMYSADTYQVTTPGGNSLLLKMQGVAIGPKIALSSSSVNFGSVEVGESNSRILTIKNISGDLAYFQFITEPNGVFKVDLVHSEGIVPAKSSIEVKLSFCPKDAINFYKRVYCLVKNENPLHIDLIGTGISAKSRPPDFFQRHVDLALYRKFLGMQKFPPEKLETLSIPEIDNAIFNLKDTFSEKSVDADRPLKSLLGPVTKEQIYDTLLEEGKENDIYIETPFVDFGACNRLRFPEPQDIVVVNKTEGKITCFWANISNFQEPVFEVVPESADIPPMQKYIFRVQFKPPLDNQFYGQNLECFAYYKTMRNFRLVTEKSMTAPWCFKTLALGYQFSTSFLIFHWHTFPLGGEKFLPKAEFQYKKLIFPACHIDDTIYQTVQLINSGDTAIKYHFEDMSSNVFVVEPRRGVLQPNQFQLLTAKFSPTQAKQYTEKLRCVLNNSNVLELLISGIGAQPELSIENSGAMYFKPTCIGVVSKRNFSLKNTCRIPISYELDIPSNYASIFQIKPSFGTLQGNQSVTLNCSFAPRRKKFYKIKIPIKVSSIAQTSRPLLNPIKKEYILTAIGEGTGGVLELEPQLTSFQSVLIGSTEKKQLLLHNTSNCYVNYEINISSDEPLLPTKEGDNPPPPLLQIIPNSGTLPANTTIPIAVRFTPQRQNLYKFKVTCELSTDSRPSALDESTAFSATCDIVAEAMYPSLTIVDARREGYTTARLWKMLSLHEINRSMNSDLTPEERNMVNFSGLWSNNPLIDKLQCYTMDFGGSSLNAHETNVYIMIENTGPIPFDWSLTFLSQLEVRKEKWVDLGKRSEDQARQDFIIDNKIFTISPLNGKLNPKETATLTMKYLHNWADVHETEVLLQLKNGKCIRIMFLGKTYKQGETFLELPSNEIELEPIAISENYPPIQRFPIHNDMDHSVEYELDLSDINRVQKENYNVPIFECLNPTGTIGPRGDFTAVQFQFAPIENKEYRAKVPIKFNGTVVNSIQLRGRGTDQQLLADGAEDPVSHQRIIVPGQLAYLSTETIMFGKVCEYTVQYRVILLKNHSDTRIAYKWQTQYMGSPLSAQPEYGIINPNENVLCKIVLRGCKPEILNTSLPCWISTETEQFEHLENEPGHGKTLTRTNSIRRKALLDTGKKAKQDDKKHNHLNSHMLYVKVKGTVISEDVYRSEANAMKNQHIDMSSGLNVETVENISKEEKTVATDILMQMVAEILRHPDVKEAMKPDTKVPSPLFAQLVPSSSHRLTGAIPPKMKEDKDIFGSIEFQELTESVLEETLFSIMAEASTGIFDLFNNVTLKSINNAISDDKDGEKHVKFGQ